MVHVHCHRVDTPRPALALRLPFTHPSATSVHVQAPRGDKPLAACEMTLWLIWRRGATHSSRRHPAAARTAASCR